MSDGPNERVTSPAMPAVDPWARVDKIETTVHGNAERCAERFGKLEAKGESTAEKCAADYATLTEQIAASARVAKGLEGRITILEAWRPAIEESARRATREAREAKKVADESIAEMKGTSAGLMQILAEAEEATAKREAEKKAERDAAEAIRIAATAAHTARFEATSEALKRHAAGIVTVGEGVTALEVQMATLASRALVAVLGVALVVIVGAAVVVMTVLWSRPAETVAAPRPAIGVSK